MDDRTYSLKKKFQSRKFLMTVGLIGVSSIFLGTKIATFNQWASFNQWVFGIYVSGNVGTFAANKAFDKRNM